MLLNIAMHRTNSYPALKVNVLRMKSYKLEARAGNIRNFLEPTRPLYPTRGISCS